MVVQPGEVHGLVGENGSGKSTLVKVLSGYHRPDPGGSLLDRRAPVDLPVRPAAARRFGLSVVHQDLGLVDSFSVLENMRIGLFGVRRFSRAIRWRQERERARASLEALGADIDPDGPTWPELSAGRARRGGDRPRAPASRAGRGADHVRRVDPSAAAGAAPALSFPAARDVVGRGGSVLLVSHQLEEVLEHTDRVTVLRDGRVVAGGVPHERALRAELIRLMLGRELAAEARTRSALRAVVHAAGPRSGTSRRCRREASFTIAAGEMVGVTGLLGSGFEELPYLLSGARPARTGHAVGRRARV